MLTGILQVDPTEALREKIDSSRLPRHIAIIMDGNGRWAKKHGKARVFGHRHGVSAVRETTEAAAELGVEYLTLYAFSTENWNRPAFEVNALMTLLVDTLGKEIQTLNKNNIRLKAIGNLSKLPSRTYSALMKGIEQTKNNDRMTLVLALNYSAKWEIVNAAKNLATQVAEEKINPEDIQESHFVNELNTAGIPDPELLVRTSGENRLSNFLLWQLAYAEFYFTDTLWPDFRKANLFQAIIDFQNRERRFGKTSEQITSA
ncbi:MAG: isoprenyl transferase [Saprospiraceae bacterium]|nr:isoprenyl transferase [Saprospiraceae bacterium]